MPLGSKPLCLVTTLLLSGCSAVRTNVDFVEDDVASDVDMDEEKSVSSRTPHGGSVEDPRRPTFEMTMGSIEESPGAKGPTATALWDWMAKTSPDHTLNCDDGKSYQPSGDGTPLGEGQGGVAFPYMDADMPVVAKVIWPDEATAEGWVGGGVENAHVARETNELTEECRLMRLAADIPFVIKCLALCSVGRRAIMSPNVMIMTPPIASIKEAGGTDWKGILRDVARFGGETAVDQFLLSGTDINDVDPESDDILGALEQIYDKKMTPKAFTFLTGQSKNPVGLSVRSLEGAVQKFQKALRGKSSSEFDLPWSLQIESTRNIVPSGMTTREALYVLAVTNMKLLQAGVVNPDQFSNMLFADSTPGILFIDFGMAKDLKSKACRKKGCDALIDDQLDYAVFDKLHRGMYASRNGDEAKKLILGAKRQAGLTGDLAKKVCEKLWERLAQEAGSEEDMPRAWQRGEC